MATPTCAASSPRRVASRPRSSRCRAIRSGSASFTPGWPDRDVPAPILLDLSRLLSSVERPAPSGIERVEMAYARRFLPFETTHACAVAPWGRLGLVDRATAMAFVDGLHRFLRG